MTPLEVVLLAKDNDILLYLKDGKLAFKASKGALTAELKAIIAENKAEVFKFLNQSIAMSEVIPKRDYKARVPLTNVQQRIWFQSQKYPTSCAYNFCMGVVLQQAVNIEELGSVIREEILKHSILCSVIKQDELGPCIQYQPQMAPKIMAEKRLTSDCRSKQDIERELFERNYNRHIDLSNGPTVYCDLFQYSEDETFFVLTSHHLFLDESSFEVITRSIIAKILELELLNVESSEITFEDYAVWLNAKTEQNSVHENYWLERLKGIPLSHSLVLDKERSNSEAGKRSFYVSDISSECISRLKLLSSELDVSLFSLLHTSFSLLIALWSRQQDIVSGGPVAGREDSQLRSVVGMFAHTLMYRATFDFNSTFNEVLKAQYQHHLSALAHQAISLDKLIEQLHAKRESFDSAHHPIFQLYFNFISLENKAQSADPLAYQQMHLNKQQIDTKFDLSLIITDDLQPSFCWSFDRSIFERSTIEHLHQGIICLLDQVVENTELPLSKICLVKIPEVKIKAKLSDKNSVLFINDFFKHAQQSPNKVAIRYQDNQLSYQELYLRVAGLCQKIKHTQSSAPIAIVGSRNINFITAMLACLASGKTYIPIDSAMPSQRRNTIMSLAGAKVVIPTSDIDIPSELTVLNADCIDVARIVTTAHGDNPAYVIFTSGSTGTPKGVAITADNLASFISSMAKKIEFNCDDSIVSITTPSFDISVVEILLPLFCGGQIVLASPEQSADNVQLGRLIEWHKPSFIQATPATWSMLIQESSLSLSDAQLLVGGEALSIGLASEMLSRGKALWNCYGPTEATVYSLVSKISEYDISRERILIGGELAHSQHLVVDRFNNPLPVGAVGELAIGGEGVGSGYWNDAAKTKEVFRDDIVAGEKLYKTGDLVQQQHNGFFRYLGRVDQQVKVRGYRIELEEIEKSIQSVFADYQPCAVATKQDASGFTSLVGYLLTSTIDTHLLEEKLSQHLPFYMVPKQWVFIDELPLNANGKVDKSSLPAPEFKILDLVVPTTESQKIIFKAWQQVLQLEQFSIDDNFFSLGGNSLLITKMLALIKHAADKQLALAQVFKYPTVNMLAACLDNFEQSLSIQTRADLAFADLSSAQLRIWLAESLGESFANHVSMAMQISGALNVGCLHKAVQEVATKHSALRTYFTHSKGVLKQAMREPADFIVPFSVVNIDKGLTDKEHLKAMYREFIDTPFNLNEGPLFRVQLVVLDGGDFVLFSVFHHIAFDGWSFGVFLNDMFEAYKNIEAGQFVERRLSNLEYLDFAYWQRQWLTSKFSQKEKLFWQNYLLNAPQETTLSPDLQAGTSTPRMAQISHTFSQTLLTDLSKVAQELECNLFNLLYAGFNLLIAKLTGQSDVVTGIPVAGREMTEIQDMIGMFVNNLAVRFVVDDSISIADFIHSHMANLTQVFEHQMLPFESVLEQQNAARVTDSTPLFQLFFNMLNIPIETSTPDGLTFSSIFEEDVAAKFDLTVYVNDIENNTQLLLVYKSHKYSEQRIRDFLQCYIKVLESFTGNLETKVCDLSLGSTGLEKRAIKSSWAGSVIDLFDHRVEKYPNQLAVKDYLNELSYKDLQQKTCQLAGLIQTCIKPNTGVVAIHVERCVESVASILAVLRAGYAFSLVDKLQGEKKVAKQIEKIAPDLILSFVENETDSKFNEDKVLTLPPIRYWNWPIKNTPRNVTAADLACITFTSGSTGDFKSVKGCHGGLANYFSWFMTKFEIGIGDRISMLSGLTHDPLQRDVFESLCTGATLVIPQESDIKLDALSKWIVENKITVTHLTPSLTQLFGEKLRDEHSLRHMFLLGELVTKSVLQRNILRFPSASIHNIYGATETQRSHSVTLLVKESDPAVIESQSPDTYIEVQQADGQPCATGQQGELIFWSESLALGYLADDDATQQKFITDAYGNRGYRTGDLGVLRANGKIKLLGRADRQIKLRGYRIELAEVEGYLLAIDGVKQAAVRLETEKEQEYLSAYIAVDETRFDMALAKRQLRGEMPIYMIPTHWAVTSALLLNANGKVDYLALSGARLIEQEELALAENDVHRRLIDIWLTFLPISQIGIDNNFFEMGGNSLDASRMLAEVKTQFGMDVSLRQIFEHSTVRDFSFLLDAIQIRSLTQSIDNNNNIEVIEL